MGKIKPTKVLGLLASALLASSAFAAEYTDGTGNNSFANAANVNGYFSTGANPNVVNPGTYPWVTIHGQGQGVADYFQFTSPGGLITLDIDNSAVGLDTTIYLYNSSQVLVGTGEDSSLSDGAAGSATPYDSFLTYTGAAGTYFVKVANYAGSEFAQTYDLQIQTPVPEPETYAMMLAGLGLMGTIARRRKTNRTV